MPKAILAAAVGLCAVAAALALVLALGVHRLQVENSAAVALKPPPLIVPAPPKPFVEPPKARAATRPAPLAPPAPVEKPKEVAKAPVKKPIVEAKPAAAPAPQVVEDPLVALKKILLDPAASMERKQAAVVQLAGVEAGAAVLLQLTEEGRLSAGLQQFAIDRLYHNAAALAGGGMFSP